MRQVWPWSVPDVVMVSVRVSVSEGVAVAVRVAVPVVVGVGVNVEVLESHSGFQHWNATGLCWASVSTHPE